MTDRHFQNAGIAAEWRRPAWAFSIVAHLCAIVLLAYAAAQSPPGIPGASDANTIEVNCAADDGDAIAPHQSAEVFQLPIAPALIEVPPNQPLAVVPVEYAAPAEEEKPPQTTAT